MHLKEMMFVHDRDDDFLHVVRLIGGRSGRACPAVDRLCWDHPQARDKGGLPCC